MLRLSGSSTPAAASNAIAWPTSLWSSSSAARTA